MTNTERRQEIHFLRGWQRALSFLPSGAQVYLVVGCGDRPKEPEQLFIDETGALLWRARQGKAALDFEIKPFTVYRESRSELTYLTPGDSGPKVCYLHPLPSDKELEAM